MSPNEIQFLKQDIRDLLRKVDSLSSRVELIESTDRAEPAYRVESSYPIPLSITTELCNCGSIPVEHCTCKLW